MNLRSTRWEALALGAILALTVGASRAAAQAAPAAPAAQEPDGQALYLQNCRTCHGAKGVAPARMATLYPALTPLAGISLPADSIVAVLQHGKGKDMKSFADRLSAAQMAAVAKFVKSLPAPAPGAP
jgi:mono/diheme cytochrome c family protein